MSAYTTEQIQAAMTAPVELVTGPRTAKVIATQRIAAPIAAAEAAKARKHRIAAEKREAREQRKLDRIAKKAQKADKANKRKTKVVKPMTALANAAAAAAKTRRKSITAQKKAHSIFKKELKTTRRNLMTGWKEQARSQKEIERAVALIFKSDEKRKKKAAKAAKKLAKEEAAAAKKAAKLAKAATPKRAKLTEDQKLANKAKRAIATEMNRRAKWEREFQGKFPAALSHEMLSKMAAATSEEPELEDGFVC